MRRHVEGGIGPINWLLEGDAVEARQYEKVCGGWHRWLLTSDNRQWRQPWRALNIQTDELRRDGTRGKKKAPLGPGRR